MLYTKALQPYVVKVYECLPNGLIAVTEFVEIFTLADFHQNQDDMSYILNQISQQFLIGDCGITGKNYVNWGTRNDGTICILDFSYIYSVKYKIFGCSCNDDALLKYDSKFVNLICPYCGRKYTFGEVRRKITRAQQEEEIGDIKNLGYILTQGEEDVEIIPEFEPSNEKKKKKKKISEVEQEILDYENGLNQYDQDWDYPEQ